MTLDRGWGWKERARGDTNVSFTLLLFTAVRRQNKTILFIIITLEACKSLTFLQISFMNSNKNIHSLFLSFSSSCLIKMSVIVIYHFLDSYVIYLSA